MILLPSPLPGHCGVEDAGLATHPVQVDDGVHPAGHPLDGHPLVLAVDGVVQGAIHLPHHAQSGAHRQAVQVARVAVTDSLGREEEMLLYCRKV